MRFSLPSIKCSAASPLPASDYCRARGNQIIEHSSEKETVLGSSRKLEGATEHLIDGSGKRICPFGIEFQSPNVVERRSNTTFSSLMQVTFTLMASKQNETSKSIVKSFCHSVLL